MNDERKALLRELLIELFNECHQTATSKGWWADVIMQRHGALERLHPLEVSNKIGLMHSELSEGLEEVRDDNYTMYFNSDKPDKPEGMTVEFMDVLIRMGDTLGKMRLIEDAVDALFAKLEYNKTRPYRHGGRAL